MIRKKKKVEWKDEYYVRIYQMVKDGMDRSAMAATLGVPVKSLAKWMEEKPALKAAVAEAARSPGARCKDGYGHFKDFAFGRLPKEAQELWDDLEAIDKEKDVDREARRNVLGMIDESPTRIRQHLFLHALIHCNFLAALACRKIGLNHNVMVRWKKEDPAFRALVDGIHEAKKDFFEAALINLVRQGDSAATIFAARSQLRHRGYNDKVDISINQTVTHQLEVRPEDLSPEVLRALIDAKRRKEQLALEDRSDVQDAEVVDG